MKQYSSLLVKVMLLTSTLFFSSCSSLLQPSLETSALKIRQANYSLDKTHAALLFKINHMGYSKYIGRFTDFDASLDFDPEHIADSKLHAIIEMSSLDVNNQDFEKTLKAGGWLNVSKFPQAIFTTQRVEPTSQNQAVVHGELTFLGVTAPLKLKVALVGGAPNPITGKYTVGFEASGQLLRSNHGLTRLLPLVGDEVELEIHVEFQKRA